MQTIVFYGDSNTQGYDPGTGKGSGKCFPDSVRWIGRIREELKGSVLICDEGKIGRCIPEMKFELEEVDSCIGKYGKIDFFCVMLGINDCLSFPRPDPGRAGVRMKGFLEYLKKDERLGSMGTGIVVIAPPYMDFTGDRFYERYGTADGSLSGALKKAAEEEQVLFIDAGPWNVACGKDHIHFSPEGHKVFAEQMLVQLDALVR